MGMYAVQTAGAGELAALRDAAGGGRAAAVSRRRALAAGRSALPPRSERVRSGLREAKLPSQSAAVEAPAPEPSNGRPAPAAVEVAVDGRAPAGAAGRVLAMQRRRLLAQGKQALGAGSSGSLRRGRSRPQEAESSPPSAAVEAPTPDTSNARPAPAAVEAAVDGRAPAGAAGRVLAMQRRRRQAQGKQALGEASTGAGRRSARARDVEPAEVEKAVTGRTPEGRREYALKVVGSPTHGGQRVTGPPIGPGSRVTGDEYGAALPVSGTHYLGADAPAPAPAGAPKVGMQRTVGGVVVSGTMVRGKVGITGDERGEHLTITGEAEAKLAEDLTPRIVGGGYAAAQFPRRTDPHGASVFGVGGGRSARTAREPRRQPLETTLGGLAVSGTAVGRSGRVTGDEAGACRPLTGNQYQGPASACGGTGGGTAPAEHINFTRRDPVTGAKVGESQTWGNQRVTGPSFEHAANVTGDEPGSYSVLTGTPYQGPSTVLSGYEPSAAQAVIRRFTPGPADAAVTGDVPRHDKAVTGTEPGAQRAVTGTPYFRNDDPATASESSESERLAAIEQAFSVSSPQRRAHLASDGAAAQDPTATGRITGSFAVGDGKVTGNNEFVFQPRGSSNGKRPGITGEGRTDGRVITGSAWTEDGRVTGTGGHVTAERNPSRRDGEPHGWAGAGRFQAKAHQEQPRQMVTGQVGGVAKAAAKVTLSGGAQG